MSKEHTVEYYPIDWGCLGHSQKERVEKMQAKGISTPYDPKKTNAEVEGKAAEKVYGSIVFF